VRIKNSMVTVPQNRAGRKKLVPGDNLLGRKDGDGTKIELVTGVTG